MARTNGENGRSYCAHCTVRQTGMCRAMQSDDALAALEAAHLPPRVLEPGATIYHQGDTADRVYNVVSGWVGLRREQADGRGSVLEFALPGDICGVEPKGTPRWRGARAITPAAVCAIGQDRLERLRHEFPMLNERFVWTLQREGQRGPEMMAAAVLGSATERVAYLLWTLAIRSLGRRPSERERVVIPLSQIDLAAATGLTPVHVSRVLRRLRDEGRLTFHDQLLAVRDIDGVEALCGLSDDLVRLFVREAESPHALRGSAGAGEERSVGELWHVRV
jgi:CRP-like cAMP-binding protein